MIVDVGFQESPCARVAAQELEHRPRWTLQHLEPPRQSVEHFEVDLQVPVLPAQSLRSLRSLRSVQMVVVDFDALVSWHDWTVV